MKLIKYPKRRTWSQLLKRPAIDTLALEQTTTEILSKVKSEGDSAIKKLSLKYEGATIVRPLVNQEELKKAEQNCDSKLKKAISIAFNNIRKFHLAQKEKEVRLETTDGVTCWRKSVGIEKVGLYIPGGSAPLFSTILMLGIPAKLAGCKEIILCTPPNSKGELDAAMLFTAKLVGIDKIFKIGGVQAIAAMAYGTETVPKVYKIFGPGNQYVACAKQLVNREGVAIDLPAGPSEVAVFADQTCVPSYVAADLLSQAEHGADSQVLLVSCFESVIKKILMELEKQLKVLPRKAIASEALKNSKAVLVLNKDEAFDLLNLYAPEHLILASKNSDKLSSRVVNAGSVFLGNYSCESAGDYASGTNHTLPTNGHAKAHSGISLDSFVKKITFQKITKKGIRLLGSAVELMAEAEGLAAHKNAVTLRLKKQA